MKNSVLNARLASQLGIRNKRDFVLRLKSVSRKKDLNVKDASSFGKPSKSRSEPNAKRLLSLPAWRLRSARKRSVFVSNKNVENVTHSLRNGEPSVRLSLREDALMLNSTVPRPSSVPKRNVLPETREPMSFVLRLKLVELKRNAALSSPDSNMKRDSKKLVPALSYVKRNSVLNVSADLLNGRLSKNVSVLKEKERWSLLVLSMRNASKKLELLLRPNVNDVKKKLKDTALRFKLSLTDVKLSVSSGVRRAPRLLNKSSHVSERDLSSL